MKSVASDARVMKILYFVRYFGDALFYSFFQLFLLSKGLPESKIGLIMAITPITSILVNPFWNFISRDANVNHKIMKIITVIEGLLIILIGSLSAFEVLAVLTCMIAIVGSPFYSLFDGYTATFTETNHMEYSKMRRMGSLAYVFGCSLGGLLIGLVGYSWVFLISGLLFIISSALLMLIKPIPLEIKVKEKRNYRVVLTNKHFYIYLIFYVLTCTVATLGDNFFGVYLTSVRELTDSQYGNVIAAWVIVEFLTMLFLGRFGEHIKDKYLFIVIGLIYFLRLLAVGLNLPTPAIIAFALLRGIAMGSILHIHLKYLAKVIGINNLTAGILIIAIVSSLVLAIGNASMGFLIEGVGYNTVFMGLGVIVLSATLMFSIYNFARRKKE